MERIEKEKRHILEADHGSFASLVFSSNGGMRPETTRVYARLNEMIDEKNNGSYNVETTWISFDS